MFSFCQKHYKNPKIGRESNFRVWRGAGPPHFVKISNFNFYHIFSLNHINTWKRGSKGNFQGLEGDWYFHKDVHNSPEIVSSLPKLALVLSKALNNLPQITLNLLKVVNVSPKMTLIWPMSSIFDQTRLQFVWNCSEITKIYIYFTKVC